MCNDLLMGSYMQTPTITGPLYVPNTYNGPLQNQPETGSLIYRTYHIRASTLPALVLHGRRLQHTLCESRRLQPDPFRRVPVVRAGTNSSRLLQVPPEQERIYCQPTFCFASNRPKAKDPKIPTGLMGLVLVYQGALHPCFNMA